MYEESVDNYHTKTTASVGMKTSVGRSRSIGMNIDYFILSSLF